MLEKAGEAIGVVEGGAATIEEVRAGNDDLVLTDVQMPHVASKRPAHPKAADRERSA